MVSILMPAYNTALFIAEAIESILTQTFTDFELLIADDASTDDTFEIVRTFLEKDIRIKGFKHPENLGFVGNKNFLLQQASGDYIAWQDSDDISYPERIKVQMDAITTFNVEIVATNLNRIRYVENNWIEEKKNKSSDCSYLIKEPVSNYPFMFATLLFSRKVLDSSGCFSQYFNGLLGEDFYWTMKANTVFPIYYVDQILYGYRVNYNSTTNTFNERKLIMPVVLNKLFTQYESTHTDWLEQEKYEDIRVFENQLLNDRKHMSEQYRIWSAKAVDSGDFVQAKIFLIKAFIAWPLNVKSLRTVFYYLRILSKKYLINI